MMKNNYLLLFIFALAACAAPSRQGNINNQISGEMNKAVEQRSKPVQADTVNNALLPPLTFDLPRGVTKPLDQRFDLVVTGAPANQVFMAIVSGTRYSMLVHPDVTGTISVNLKDVTISEALDAIREIYGYEYKVEGSRIFIQPITLQTRVFQVNYLIGQRQGRTDLRVSSGSVGDVAGPGGGGASPTAATTVAPTTPGGVPSLAGSAGVSSRISTTSQNDFWQEVTAAIKSIVGGEAGRNVVVSPQSGVVVVRAMPRELREVAAFLKATRLSVDRQVMIEAKIIKVQLSDGYQAGINWAAFRNTGNSHLSIGQVGPTGTLQNSGVLSSTPISSSNTGITAGANLLGSAFGSSLFGLAFQTSNFAALIQFLESQGNAQILSSPRIATINNQKAVLKVGTDQFFVTSINTTPGTTGANPTQPTSTVITQPFFSGIALDITPQIDENGMIILHVHPSVSTVTDDTKQIDVGSGNIIRLPLAKSTISETDSIVRVENGNIVAIGGLMTQESTGDQSQIPGVGNVPVVGALFRNTNRAQTKSELVILIKPTVIQSDENWRQDLVDTRDRLQQFDTDRRGVQ